MATPEEKRYWQWMFSGDGIRVYKRKPSLWHRFGWMGSIPLVIGTYALGLTPGDIAIAVVFYMTAWLMGRI